MIMYLKTTLVLKTLLNLNSKNILFDVLFIQKDKKAGHTRVWGYLFFP